MAELEFDDLTFTENQQTLRINFMKLFYVDVDRSEVNKISQFKTKGNKIIFSKLSEDRARKKFMQILGSHFKSDLRNKIAGKQSFYIHKYSGIPLTGTNYFGLIDRGTNIIEIKPLTSCNLSCMFCSVDEGPKSRRKTDFIIEKDYLVGELKKLIEFKGVDCIDAHINSQGEPTLYSDIVGLVKDIKAIPGVKVITIDTNGTLLTKKLIDDLADAGLTRFNLSLNAIDQDIANKMAGFPYPLKRVMEMATYATTKMDLLIAPVFLPGVNDSELPKLAKFAHKIGAGKHCPAIGIQNFLPYRFGRNPVTPMPIEEFLELLKKLEKQHNVELICTESHFNIVKCKEYPRPFKKDQIIKAELVLPGRLRGEMLAAAENRIIAVPKCDKPIGSKVKIKITRSKHNIFIGEMI